MSHRYMTSRLSTVGKTTPFMASANGTTSRTQASDTPFEIRNSINLIELWRRRFGRSPCRMVKLVTKPAVSVLTQHNDNTRTGANLQEATLTVATDTNANFGKLAFRLVNGGSQGNHVSLFWKGQSCSDLIVTCSRLQCEG